jgi:hypothetical protein
VKYSHIYRNRFAGFFPGRSENFPIGDATVLDDIFLPKETFNFRQERRRSPESFRGSCGAPGGTWNRETGAPRGRSVDLCPSTAKNAFSNSAICDLWPLRLNPLFSVFMLCRLILSILSKSFVSINLPISQQKCHFRPSFPFSLPMAKKCVAMPGQS